MQYNLYSPNFFLWSLSDIKKIWITFACILVTSYYTFFFFQIFFRTWSFLRRLALNLVTKENIFCIYICRLKRNKIYYLQTQITCMGHVKIRLLWNLIFRYIEYYWSLTTGKYSKSHYQPPFILVILNYPSL